MGHVLLLAVFATVAAVALVRPWVGVVAAYCTVILQPQAVWWWDFAGLRPDLWVLLPTAVGIAIGIPRGHLDLTTLRNRRNLYISVLWICIVASYFLGPYAHVVNRYRQWDSSAMLSLVDKMFLLYFMAVLCIDTERKVMALFYVMCGSAAYLVYWANVQYFVYHVYGRLEGPGANGEGIYVDQNAFAMLFVVAQAFFWYFGLSRKSVLLRWGSWLVIPFSWNAVFMTGSRGGLLGLGVTIILIALRSRYKLFRYALIPAFVLVFIWQGGFMRNRADTIADYQADASAEGRLEAWQTALREISAYPLTGVGVESFTVAFPYYSKYQPREAHDTLLQITAESGVIAGLMYVLIISSLVRSLWKIAGKNGFRRGRERTPAFIASEATMISFVGLVVCSIFLSLQAFEIFYCLNAMANAVIYLERKHMPEGLAQDSQRSGSPGPAICGG